MTFAPYCRQFLAGSCITQRKGKSPLSTTDMTLLARQDNLDGWCGKNCVGFTRSRHVRELRWLASQQIRFRLYVRSGDIAFSADRIVCGREPIDGGADGSGDIPWLTFRWASHGSLSSIEREAI